MPATDRLAAYLNDHRAGATAALHLIERMASSDDDATPHAFLHDLRDRVTLTSAPSRTSCGWLGEKLTRVRLSDVVTGSIHLCHLLELETIALGLHGKRSMWEVLAHLMGDDARLADIDFDELVARADRQQDEVQQHRRSMAEVALT